MVSAFESGEIDANYQTTGDTILLLDEHGLEKSDVTTAATLVLRTNVTKKPYDKQEVRKALQLAVDNDDHPAARLQWARHGGGKPPCLPDPSGIRQASADRAAISPKAKKMMADAGHADTEFELISYDAQWVKNTADAIGAQMREAGFKIKRTVIPGDDVLERLDEVSLVDDRMEHASARRPGLCARLQHGRRLERDGLFQSRFRQEAGEALAIADADKRRVMMKDLEQILQDSGIIIQPYWRSLYRHTHGQVHDFPMHQTFEMHLDKVWIDQLMPWPGRRERTRRLPAFRLFDKLRRLGSPPITGMKTGGWRGRMDGYHSSCGGWASCS